MGPSAEPINAKTSENPVRFHVPLMFTLAVGDCANKNNWKHFLFLNAVGYYTKKI